MKTHLAYCSACDRDVEVMITESPDHDAQAPIPDPEIVCLDIGAKCTGSLCPVGAVSPAAMMARRIRAGVRTVLQPVVTARCERCARVTSWFLVDPKCATCADCGETVERDRLELAVGHEG